jgi:hypothetical protein
VHSTVAGTIGHWYFRIVPAHMRASQISEAEAAAAAVLPVGSDSPSHQMDATDDPSNTTVGANGERTSLSTITFNNQSSHVDDHVSSSIPLLCFKL